MKKRVLLIHPFGTTYGNASLIPSIPMGLLYLTSYLRSQGFDVYFLDALAANPNRVVKVEGGRRCGLSEFQLKKKILKINPDIVGTPIYEIFKKEGWLMKDRHLLFSEDVACRTKYFSGEEIIKLQNMFYKKFIIKRWLTPYSIIRITQK